MIIVKLIGGLGNQLFQYAAGKSLSESLNTDLYIDDSNFETYKLHKYALNHFNIQFANLNLNELNDFLRIKDDFLNKINGKFNLYHLNIIKNQYIVEPHFHFWNNFFKLKNNVYLDGYWQSEKYFNNINSTIYKHFEIITPISNQNQVVLNQIISSNSISLHIRRGDYINNQINIHNVCDFNYYSNAISIIEKQIKNPTFFVFSDDMDWVKQNFKINHDIVYVDINNADTNYEDLRLMSNCKHNIIANSSFSWWGAYLNQNPEKICIAPKRWFNSDKYDFKDIIPDTWMKI